MPSSAAAYTLSLHDALPICLRFDEVYTGPRVRQSETAALAGEAFAKAGLPWPQARMLPELDEHQADRLIKLGMSRFAKEHSQDRKSTRLNSSHTVISYAVFCRCLHSFPTRRSSDLLAVRRSLYRPARAAERNRGPGRRGLCQSGAPLAPSPNAPGTRRTSGRSAHQARNVAIRQRAFARSEEHTSELQSHSDLVCRLLPLPTLFPYTTLFRSACGSTKSIPARACGRAKPRPWPARPLPKRGSPGPKPECSRNSTNIRPIGSSSSECRDSPKSIRKIGRAHV